MSENLDMNTCEEFAELCALATTDSLNAEECQKLETHIARCKGCNALLREYRELVSSGLSALAVERGLEETASDPAFSVSAARERLLAAMESATRPTSSAVLSIESGQKRRFNLPGTRSLIRVAAVLIFAAALSYLVGVKVGVRQQASTRTDLARTHLADILSQKADVISQKTLLERKLAEAMQQVSELEVAAQTTDKQLAELKSTKANLEARVAQLSEQTGQQAASLTAAISERTALEQKLRDGEAQLRNIRQQLHSSEDDQHNLQLRAASLEMQVNHLSAQVNDQEDTSTRQQNYLAQDRDIRELMGARQLYIADVFDVDSQGHNRKAFGRVFFTKGKSLIFYAFDLDKQPGYRNASAFQAWGQPSANQTSPVSLGIFYMDSEANRRWVLRASNPKILDEISAVFVTVEPKGGSKKPTNHPFLLAYLHATPPNHP